MITKAVFPVAGLGTRFLPATKAQPKEMLCVVDKPLIQYAVEEAYRAGVRHMIFVTGRNKRAIEDHFDTAYELEAELERKQSHALLEVVRSVQPGDMVTSYVRQPRSLGLGHAVLCAEHLVGSEDFAVLLADDLMLGEPPIMSQMCSVYQRLGRSIIAVEPVAPNEVERYGIVEPQSTAPTAASGAVMPLKSLVEKPPKNQAPSNLAVVGRYILNCRIFDLLRQQAPGRSGEIQLTDAISRLADTDTVYAYVFSGQRYDCGSKIGYLQATVHLAEQHPEMGQEFKAWLRARA